MHLSLPRLGSVGVIAALSACAAPAPEAETELHNGARVQFPSAGTDPWTEAIVADVGGCTMLAVPWSWDSDESFRLVRIDSLRALRVSTRYDGRMGPDSIPRTAEMPPDTVGEEWTELPMDAVRARYGGCEPSLGGG